MPKRALGAGHRGWDLDVDDQPDQYIVRAEAPGFEPDEFDVQISGNLLTVKAEHKEETKDEKGTSHRYGAIQSSFTLPEGIVLDNVKAHYKNGVLELRLPKSENAKAKRISVTA
jgi:HSP20 family protein